LVYLIIGRIGLFSIMITYDPSLKIFTSSLISDESYFSGFGTKELGDGMKIENIVKFLSDNEINYDKLVILGQIHSTNIEYATNFSSDKINKIEDTDGVITDTKKIVLAVRTADCLPIVYVDKNAGIIGISHQGWRGSLKKMTVKMVEKMVYIGAKKEAIKVAIGPGIGLCCYDVDDDRYYDFIQELDGYSEKIFHNFKGRKHLNLTLLNYLLLLSCGIKKENIDFFPFCTSCDSKRFFSFRKSRKKDFEETFSLVMKKSS